MRLYNTLSGTTERFTTPDGKVRIYVCGVTPYAAAHVGHAMCSVVFDVVRRFLEFRGYKVNHVQNFTDIDDKMIAVAASLGISVQELAERNIEAYFRDMDQLNVLRADVYPRATDEIPRILEMIGVLVEKGFAYAMKGDVYFRVRRHEEYGKLSHRSLDSLKAGARVEIDEDKEDVIDFALWKSQKPGEPAWDSPWGPGRPGWHIECSAMSLEYLGKALDIHGGGQDLIFPHHENELAQTEAYADGGPFVRFWLHNGLLRLGDDKMSKSLGNIITVEDALSRYSPDALRLFFLSSHYRTPLVFGEEIVTAQERALERLRNAVKPAEAAAGGDDVDMSEYRERFIEAMEDDLNTPRALAALFDLARDINRGRVEGHDVGEGQQTLKDLAGVLGLTLAQPRISDQANVEPFIQLLIEIRSDLRVAKQFDLADRVRHRLADLGVALEDTPRGTEWVHRSS